MLRLRKLDTLLPRLFQVLPSWYLALAGQAWPCHDSDKEACSVKQAAIMGRMQCRSAGLSRGTQLHGICYVTDVKYSERYSQLHAGYTLALDMTSAQLHIHTPGGCSHICSQGVQPAEVLSLQRVSSDRCEGITRSNPGQLVLRDASMLLQQPPARCAQALVHCYRTAQTAAADRDQGDAACTILKLNARPKT